jgi:hypothetical protein
VEELLDPFLVRLEAGQRQFVVLDKVVGDEVAEAVDISRADELVQAPHGGRMFHRVLLGWWRPRSIRISGAD